MTFRPIIITGICAVLFVAAVYFGGKYTLEQRRTEYSRQSKRSLTKWKNHRAIEPTENSPIDTSMTNRFTAKQETSETKEPDPIVNTEVSTTTEESETPQTQNEAVSPYGFGPYPQVPDDYPFDPGWPASTPPHELLERVKIKLWKQGIRAEGAIFENGLIYPIIRGTAYIR